MGRWHQRMKIATIMTTMLRECQRQTSAQTEGLKMFSTKDHRQAKSDIAKRRQAEASIRNAASTAACLNRKKEIMERANTSLVFSLTKCVTDGEKRTGSVTVFTRKEHLQRLWTRLSQQSHFPTKTRTSIPSNSAHNTQSSPPASAFPPPMPMLHPLPRPSTEWRSNSFSFWRYTISSIIDTVTLPQVCDQAWLHEIVAYFTFHFARSVRQSHFSCISRYIFLLLFRIRTHSSSHSILFPSISNKHPTLKSI